MHLALLALALAASPDLPGRFLRDACPDTHKDSDSNVELKRKLEERATCARKAMDKELDRVIVPWKKRDAARFHAWMALQAEDNAWTEAVCDLAEELFWVDLDAGTRSDGTARSTTRMACLLGLRSHRGAFARAIAEKELRRWQRFLEGERDGAAKAQAELDQVLAVAGKLQAVDAGPPPRDAVELPLTRADWARLAALATRVKEGPAKLAAGQCALLPEWKECAAVLEPALLSLARPGKYGGAE